MEFPIGASATVDELTDDPHPLLARLRQAEPVSWLPALNGWLVTAYTLADRVLRDPTTFTVDDPRFSTARVVGTSMLSTDGPAHTHHRSPFTRPFRPADVQARFATSIRTRAAELVAELKSTGSADLRSRFAGPLAVAVVADLLGLDVAAATVLAWYAAISDAVSGVSAGREIPTAGEAAFESLTENVRATIARGEGLLASAVQDGLTADEAVSNAAVLMFGGIDTTDGMITNALLHLLPHPDSQSDIDNAIEESLRLEPAAAVVDRYATRDVTLGNAQIGKGQLVTVSLAGANRDPDVFENPNQFNPHRHNARQHLTFARGPHFCLGADLARLETKIAIETIQEQLRNIRVEPARPKGLVFRKPKELQATWTTY